MTRILMLVLAMALCLSCAAYAEEETAAEAVSTPAYIFWQDSDWWPAVSNNTDDYWTPAPATVTGEGWYTVGVTAHMPSWFYSGGNHNTGAQKLAVVITDGSTLFPEMYMQIVDIRVDGVSYACGDVTYGQTGYDNIAEDGTVFWKSSDSYGLIYDQWMIDNAGTVGTGNTWKSTAEAQKFDVFDVSVLNDPVTIEIDFFLSAQQDVEPEGGPALRVLSEGPATYAKLLSVADTMEVPENATTARMFWLADNWWVGTQDNNFAASTDVTIIGEGEYTTNVYFPDKGGWSFAGQGSNALKLGLVIDGAFAGDDSIMKDMYVGISDLRINGESVAVEGAGFGKTYFDDDFFKSDDGVVFLYHQWVTNKEEDGSYLTWEGKQAVSQPVDGTTLGQIYSMELDFFITDTAGELPEEPDYEYTWYSNNTMGVAGYSLRDDLGIGNKWYNVVPVNMTKDGIYKIPLVASNNFVIGNAIVTVDGDNVTVDYEVQGGQVKILSECMKWFASIDEITADFVNAPESEQVFGEAYSKADLGDVAYLFICNRVTYSQPVTNDGVFLADYYHGHPMWKAYRAGLDAMVAELTPVEEVVDSPDAEAVESPDAEAVAE